MTVTAAPLEHARQVYSSDRIAEFVEGGFWLNRLPIDYLRDNAEHRPDRDAVVDEHRRCTWHELHVRVDRLATGLADLGLEPGDFVGVQLPNTAEFVEVYLAVQRAGLRAVTIMAIYRDRDVAYMLAKTRARALVIPDQHRGWDHRDMAARLAPDLPALRHVIVVGEPADGMVSLDSLDRPARPDLLNARRPDPDECSKVGFTSGTTGRPKGVVHTHNTDLVPPRQLGQVLGLDENSTIWMPSPIAHATGLLFGVYGSLLSGAPLVLQDRWDAGRALELIEREHVAMTVGATPFMAAMLDHPDLPHRDVSSFRYFACGGAVIPPRLVERANGEMGTRLLRVFGHSEAPLHTLNRPDDPWDKLLNTDGRLLPGCEVRISGPERLGLAGPDEVGEYATRGPHVFLGYFDEPELTAECRDADGWYHSGDLCRIDDDGHVTFVDRVKDIINRGGVKISALEVENVVREHPDVAQCAAVAMPDARLGERICVFVVPRAGAAVTLEQVTAMFDAGGVTRQKWPESLITVPELPSTPTGKVQKKLLRQQLENGDR